MAHQKYSFVVMKYKGRDTAVKALKTLLSLERERIVKLTDAVAVRQEKQGKVKLTQGKELTSRKGSVRFGAAGLLAGLVIGGPLALGLVGAAAGAAAGKFFDTGLKNKIVEELGQELSHDDSALCVLISEPTNWPALRERMAAYEGDILVTELTATAVEALGQLAANPDVASAVTEKLTGGDN